MDTSPVSTTPAIHASPVTLVMHAFPYSATPVKLTISIGLLLASINNAGKA
jgi:hypothetical protein